MNLPSEVGLLLGLSVRFAASLVKLHDSDLKLLVLDDLLVSLDMSNRMKVVEIRLTETFANYQKIILTYDLGIFREFRRMIGPSHPDRGFVRLVGDPAASRRVLHPYGKRPRREEQVVRENPDPTL